MTPTQYWKFTGANTLQTPEKFLHGPPYIPMYGFNTCSWTGGGEIVELTWGLRMNIVVWGVQGENTGAASLSRMWICHRSWKIGFSSAI